MIGVSLAFIFLFGLVWLFERKERALDAFQVATVVLVPLMVYALFMVCKLLGMSGAVIDALAFGAFVLATFAVLFKTLGIKVVRSLLYTGAVVVFSVGASAMLPAVLGQ